MILRPYQTKLIDLARESMRINRAVFLQAPTGTGKTPVIAAICSRIAQNKKRAWIIVPRTELLKQASNHLTKWKTPHGIIAPGREESKAYNIHVVSKDTLIRRYDRIKNPPDIAIIDEAHLNYHFQLEFYKNFPDTKIIGFSATPERLSGEGLSIESGGIYDDLVESESIPWMTEHDYLSKLKYFAPQIEGLDSLRRRGTEYIAEDLDALLKRKRIYGECINHYRKHTDGKSALVFCRDVKSAYETADRFCDAGYKFFCIEGKMSGKERKRLITALGDGEIHGLTNCEIATYGLDIPRVEVGICLRPTLSRALYMQMTGRILRAYEGKECAWFFDHVNNVFEHEEPEYPGIPLHYVPHIEWNFDGTEKRKRKEKNDTEISLRLCPKCFLYFEGDICPNCGAEARKRKQTPIEVVDADLKELKPVKYKDRPPEEKREFVDRINSAIAKYKESDIIHAGAVGELLEVADQLGNSVMWVYWKLVAEDRKSVNVSLLHEIARQKRFKPGWVWYQKNNIKQRKVEVREYKEAIGI